jgi:hypothetical protein
MIMVVRNADQSLDDIGIVANHQLVQASVLIFQLLFPIKSPIGLLIALVIRSEIQYSGVKNIAGNRIFDRIRKLVDLDIYQGI